MALESIHITVTPLASPSLYSFTIESLAAFSQASQESKPPMLAINCSRDSGGNGLELHKEQPQTCFLETEALIGPELNTFCSWLHNLLSVMEAAPFRLASPLWKDNSICRIEQNMELPAYFINRRKSFPLSSVQYNDSEEGHLFPRPIGFLGNFLRSPEWPGESIYLRVICYEYSWLIPLESCCFLSLKCPSLFKDKTQAYTYERK